MKDGEISEGADAFAGVGDLSGFFAPSWAKEDEADTVRVVGGYTRRDDDDRREGGVRGGFGRRDGGRDARRDGPGRGRDGEGRGRDGEGRDRPPRRPPFQQDRDGRGRDGGFQRRPPEKPLSLLVRFLPDGRALDAIIRRIQTTRRAYPFRDIVKLFRKDDASLAVRIEVDKEADPEGRLCQCRVCSLPALTDEELTAHLLDRHLGDYFDARVVETDPPKGNFPCVARCGLTGELLGPPNHHSFSAKVQEMLRERFPNMREAEYRSHVEMVKEPEAIEQWREAARHQTLYFRKADPKPSEEAAASGAEGEAPTAEASPEPEPAGITRAEAEAIFRKDIMPGLMSSASHIVCQAKALKNMPNRRLASLLNNEFAHDEEMRSQGTLARAVHAAFHRRNLHFFRTNDDHGQEFVSAVAPITLDTSNVTEEIRSIVGYVEANQGCQAKTLVEAVAKDGGEEAVRRVSASLRWLVEKGHVVEFFNGALALGAAHPALAQKQRKPEAEEKKEAPAEAEKGTTEATEKTEVAEAPAEPAEAPAEPVETVEAPAAPAEPAETAEAPAETAETVEAEKVTTEVTEKTEVVEATVEAEKPAAP